MSLATRCPACETIFRISTQDATARGGQVRCGVCGTLFNALDALVNAGELAHLPEPALTEHQRQPDATSVAPEVEPDASAVPIDPADPSQSAAPVSAADDADFEIILDDVDVDPKDTSTALEPDAAPVAADTNDATTQSDSTSQTESGATSESKSATAVSPGHEAGQSKEADTEIIFDGFTSEPVYEPSFRETQPFLPAAVNEGNADDMPSHPDDKTPLVLSASNTATPSDPLLSAPHFASYTPSNSQGLRWLFAGLSLLGVLALAGQAAYVWRNTIAATWPATKPALLSACALLQCRVDLPMAIDHLSIESSELQAVPDTKESYTFSTLLRSRHPTALRYPNIELTLTDALNQVVLRRVLTPEQYLDATQRRQISQGVAANTELPIKITFDVQGTAIIGYRVGLFYP